MRDRDVFIGQSLEILNVFSTLTLKDFLKNANPFQNTGVPSLVESTKIENATFPQKATLCQKPKWEYKMDLSQGPGFCQKLLYFFQHFVSV